MVEQVFPSHAGSRALGSENGREFSLKIVWHYDGATVEDYDALERDGKLTVPQAIWRQGLRSFVRLKPELAPVAKRNEK